MNILYVSTLIPQSLLDEVLKVNPTGYVVAPQKFHRNLVNGFMANGHKVKVLSYLPVEITYCQTALEEGVEYYFCKYKTKPGIKHIQIAKSVFNKIKNLIKEGMKPDFIICDILNVSLCLGALLASKRFRIKIAAIVTDFLGISKYEEKGIIPRLASSFINQYISRFDAYVILTQQMNQVVNPYNKPYIVMEGLCDKSTVTSKHQGNSKTIFYAGGRPVKDGVDLLINAFKRIDDPSLRLNIYGPIPDVAVGPDVGDARITYFGTVDNKTIVAEECNSYLLINPRPIGEEYTKYSFPSKVMEYMATGVPMVTTKLAGIPEEYYDYVYTFERCNADSYYETLLDLLSKPAEELKQKGLQAQRFVLTTKNNVAQTKRIINLICELK